MSLVIPHVDIVKASLGDAAIQALLLVFSESSGIPPVTPDARFRADHPELMEVLNTLGWSGFLLKQDHAKGHYRVSGYALPLIDSPRAIQLLEYMGAAYEYLRAYYDEHLRVPLSTWNLVNSLGQNSELVLEALCYMQDIDGWHVGLSGGFPMDDGSFVVNEQVLVSKSFGDLLARPYEWHYVNPKNTASVARGLFEQIGESESQGVFNDASATKYPEWYDKLDDKKMALLIEIDFSIRNDLSALPMMGLRALLDSVMVDHVGDVGGFEVKLEQFIKNGHVTSQHADVLSKVLDAGHASMHRLYIPNVEDLRTCEDVVKHLLQELYVLHPKVKVMAENTPPRPKLKN